jgi:hypothetical protein
LAAWRGFLSQGQREREAHMGLKDILAALEGRRERPTVRGILAGDVFTDPAGCPILWLHGYWQRPTGVVLNAGEYSTAYKPSLYRKTFERLWEQDHLVFVGFSFSDPQFTFMVGEMLRESPTWPQATALVDRDIGVRRGLGGHGGRHVRRDVEAREEKPR